MSNEHCLVFARATGLFPDPAQQFFLLCLFFAALCYGCIAFAAAAAQMLPVFSFVSSLRPSKPFRFRRATTHY